MAIGRLVVIEGPDVGLDFSIPTRGGGIGRGEENIVQLSDLSVSRVHCRLEVKSGRLTLIDPGSRNRTLVNGNPVSNYTLNEGDEIKIGATRLSYLPASGSDKPRVRQVSRATMEIGSRQLLALTGDRLAVGDGRAQRYLTSLARLGETLGALEDRSTLASSATSATLSALAGDRAFLLVRDRSGQLATEASALAPSEQGRHELSFAPSLVEKVLGEGKCVASVVDDERTAIAAPLVVAGRAIGLLYIERRGEPAWDEIDLTAALCLSNLIAGGMEGLDTRAGLKRENNDLREALGPRDFIGASPGARELLAFVAKVAPTDATVLLTGESGSGKEMIARALHTSSRRAKAAFVAVNCAALTDSLIESELFGHEKGAFTGATERKIGRFEAADTGTLFLDEVGELPLDCQTKFLRVLEEQVFERVGGTKSLRVDVRVIAATNRDLAAMVRQGTFREDLYYRLSVIHTEVVPLRKRPEDIAVLADHFLARLRKQVPRKISGFSKDARVAMQRHPWPGNVRELRNAVERAIVMGGGELLTAADLPMQVTEPMLGASAGPAGARAARANTNSAAQADSAPLSLRELERRGIVAALAATGGNKAKAASLLEIDRSTLYKKIKDYEL